MIISWRMTLLGLALALGGCQGELFLRSAAQTQVSDMATPADLTPAIAGVSFADINRDMDEPIYGCTSAASACHGGSSPTGVMALQSGFTASNSMTILMANYSSVTAKEVNLANPATSNLLLRPLANSGITHTGGKVFMTTADPTYQRWLKWIELGAKLQFVPFTAASPDLSAASPSDMTSGDLSPSTDLPTDLPRGGG